MALQCGLIIVFSVVAGIGYNMLNPRGVNPFRTTALIDRPGEPGSTPDTVTSNPAAITMDEAHRRFVDGSAFFIDAREPGDYERSRIPGAVSVSPYDFEQGIPEVLNYFAKDSPLIIYCNGPGCPLAEEVFRELQALNYLDLAVFTEGFDGWVARGYPLEGGGR